MNPVGWFEIPVTNMERAKTFYEAVFGFEMCAANVNGYDMAFFPMQSGLPGAAGTLIAGHPYAPSKTGTIVYFATTDIEGTLAKVERSGGKTILQKKSIGEHGFIGWLEDCEGNTIALHSRT
ncbi:MAG: VOC family protein [Planctomycetaceae bacterium]|nr:VOC family protein [Planctomycetaceae bacterium]